MRKDVTRIYWPGEVLCREGEPGTELFFIQEGRVKVCRTIRGEELVLAELGASSVVGEMAVIDQEPRSATVVALEPTKVIPMSPGKLRAIFRHAPGVAVSIVKLLSIKLREADDKIGRGFSLNDWVFWRRTVYLLTLLAAVRSPQAEQVRLRDEETRTDLAVGLGLSHTEADQVINRLISAGLIKPSTDSSHISYLSLEITELREFFSFLDRYLGSGQRGGAEGMPAETWKVASKLVELCRDHYGRPDAALSTFKRDTLIEFVAGAVDLFPEHRPDVRRKLIEQQLDVLQDLGFMKGEKSTDGPIWLDLGRLAESTRDQKRVQLCIERYRILTGY
jgi:CRP-like cAMP-binding protein